MSPDDVGRVLNLSRPFVQEAPLLSFGAGAPQEADAFFRLVVRSLSFVIVECIHKFARIE